MERRALGFGKDSRRTSPRFEEGSLEWNVELLRAFETVARDKGVHPRAESMKAVNR